MDTETYIKKQINKEKEEKRKEKKQTFIYKWSAIRSEALFDLKWIFVSVLVCSLIGIIAATVKVIFFEQTIGGQSAVHKECVLFDEKCSQDCEDEQIHSNRPTSCNCCLKYSAIESPLGIRIKELAKFYGLICGGIGVTVGMIIAVDKKNKIFLKNNEI